MGSAPGGFAQGPPFGNQPPAGPTSTGNAQINALMSAPWLLGALGIVAAFAVTQLSDVIFSFQHFPGLPARARVLRFFGMASLGWAIALVVAAILVSLGGRVYRVEDRSTRERLRLVRLGVAGAAALVTVSAVIDLITSLSAIGLSTSGTVQVAYASIGLPAGVDGAFTSALSYIAIILISGTTALWAYALSKAKD